MDIQYDLFTVNIWESLKNELRSQFFPENVEIIAGRKLREVRHTRNIKD